MKPASLLLAASLTLSVAPALHSAEPAKPAKKAPPSAATPPAPVVPPGESAAAKGDPLPPVVATVEGAEIKRDELEAAFGAMLSRQGATPEAVPADQRAPIYRMILDNLIVSRLVEKRSAETKVPEEEVNSTFDKIKARFGSEEEFKKQAEANGQSPETLKGNIRDSLRQQHWVESQVKDAKPVTDADVEAFFKENPDQFKQPEQVRASHILIKVPEDAKPDVVVEKEKAAEAAAKRVKGGEDFAKVAKELSEDPGSKETGGDLDFFTEDKMVPEFGKAAFGMKKDAISDPVRSQFGYHIIKVTDRKDAETMKLEEVKPQLLSFLQRQKRQAEVSQVLQQMRASADVKVNLPEPVVPAPGALPPGIPAPGAPAAPAKG